MDRRKLSVRGVDPEVLEMLNDLRDYERRFIGAIVTDAIKAYYEMIFDCSEDAE